MKLKRGLLLLCCLVVAFVVGVSLYARQMRQLEIRAAFPPEVKQVLDKSEKFYLYSLQAERLPAADLKTMPNFHGYPISGQTPIRPVPQRGDLIAALWEGLGKQTKTACFAPHYGVRAVRGRKTVDLLICFACEEIEIYDDRGLRRITVSSSAQRVFNRVLAEYDVPLPEP